MPVLTRSQCRKIEAVVLPAANEENVKHPKIQMQCDLQLLLKGPESRILSSPPSAVRRYCWR